LDTICGSDLAVGWSGVRWGHCRGHSVILALHSPRVHRQFTDHLTDQWKWSNIGNHAVSCNGFIIKSLFSYH